MDAKNLNQTPQRNFFHENGTPKLSLHKLQAAILNPNEMGLGFEDETTMTSNRNHSKNPEDTNFTPKR